MITNQWWQNSSHRSPKHFLTFMYTHSEILLHDKSNTVFLFRSIILHQSCIFLLWDLYSISITPVLHSSVLWSGGLVYTGLQSVDMDSSCCGINGGVTLPVAWTSCSIAFNGMPVIAARWPSASNAASRDWLLFLLASVTIDVISDSQPWMRREFSFSVNTKSASTSWIKINLAVNQCWQANKMASIVRRASK